MNNKQAQIQTQTAEIQALKAQLKAKDSLLTQLITKTDEMQQKVEVMQQTLQSSNQNISDADASFEDVGGEDGTDEWGFTDGGAATYAWVNKTEAPQKVQEKGNADSTKININSEKYGKIIENEFITTTQTPTSTFSIDADGASYSNLKRYVLEEEVLKTPQLPPKNAIRLEEMINYFSYDYPNPTNGKPIFVDGEVSDCPWNQEHKLVRIGFKGKTYQKRERPSSNLVFLIDVSGSMSEYLPLVKESFELLVNELSPNDKVAIVVYAGAERLELPSTSVSNKELILQHLHDLGSGGSTNGAQGIITAYDIATQNFIPNANNRVILATDGDFNVGVSSREDLTKLIEKQRESGVFLSVIGCGTGNYNDEGLEALADHGNGIFEYLNTIQDAQKIFVQEFDKFFTVAKDVKIQIDFNPQMVASYRLIGYENRLLNKEDFADDTKDAGDLSAGQSLTALYEILPAKRSAAGKKKSIRSLQINFRYKEPNEGKSELISIDVVDNDTKFDDASENLRFAATVSSLGMLLRDSKFKGTTSLPQLKDWAENARTYDANGYRKEFLRLLEVIETIKK
jgi:Ca-activated chloride channel family protein